MNGKKWRKYRNDFHNNQHNKYDNNNQNNGWWFIIVNLSDLEWLIKWKPIMLQFTTIDFYPELNELCIFSHLVSGAEHIYLNNNSINESRLHKYVILLRQGSKVGFFFHFCSILLFWRFLFSQFKWQFSFTIYKSGLIMFRTKIWWKHWQKRV